MKVSAWRRYGKSKVALSLMGAGLLAGFANGLLGAGGGIIAVFAFAHFLRGEEYERRDLYANALCVMLPISAVSCIRYSLHGHLVTEGFGALVLPAIAGGVLGGLLLGKLGASILKKLFGILVVLSGVLLIIR
ncbi:MAG: TSUP family transporter [Clostridia bacterium]|nr:TSUP family transporter [Clostridia bacterium]